MAGRADYEERKERRKEIYQERATKAELNSKAHYEQHNKISSMIPFRTTYIDRPL